ncbi:MAG: hypothetical protein J6W75_12725 [Bacteroidaceae bacterium]|nr:hypothetical protein [Bacteroidaceae bacterium]
MKTYQELKNFFFIFPWLLLFPPAIVASEQDSLGGDSRDLLRQTEVMFEVSATASTGDFAPLWLTANRYGLSSVRPMSNYERVRLERDIRLDAGRNWQLGYGADVALAFGHERTGIVQQAYVEVGWKRLRLLLGQKQQPLEMMNKELSTGAMTFGINARPIPKARLDIDWFSFPGTKGWWQWRLYGAYGFMTDGLWQQKWSQNYRYSRHVLYHEKALHWQFGRADVFPLTYEIGLNFAGQFGGSSYQVFTSRSEATTYHYESGFRAFWNILTMQGNDATDGDFPNVGGNTLGSWVMQLRYHGKKWQARAYWERFFEDHSMLTVQYGIYDMLLGGEVTLPRNPYVTAAVVEYLGTKNQTGPVFHDPTPSMTDHIAGRDNYYNHLNYAGWENYGMSIGNPLITSPLYNDAFGKNHRLFFYNNRVRAWHVGLSGDPSAEWHWRALLSFTRGWGTYSLPFVDDKKQTYALAEATYRPRWAQGWQGTLALGLDHGDLIGNSFGGQLTISKTLKLKR